MVRFSRSSWITLYLSIFFLLPVFIEANAQQRLPDEPEPLGIALENYEYPYPVHYLELEVQGKEVRMAYMDVDPSGEPNGETVVLMHGKNFFGAYWEKVIRALSNEGYRVVVPDQIGFGKSSKPDIHYSFHQMGVHTLTLLDELGVEKTTVGGHSMGGMVASRFARVSALTAQMVYEQPVIHEFPHIETPVLLIIGQEDRTALGRGRVKPGYEQSLGYYPDLGKQAADLLPDATLVELEDVGHTPHFEAFEPFMNALKSFLAE